VLFCSAKAEKTNSLSTNKDDIKDRGKEAV
jgi:hypothetical protein